jgi:hypothetical protein
MQYLIIPTFQTLRGEEAIKALTEYIKELEEQKPMELTEKQTNALIQFARGLISSIQSEATSKRVKPRPSFPMGIGLSSETAGIFGASYR